jgi:hypothetical protein
MEGWEGKNGYYTRKGKVYFDQARFMLSLKRVPRHLKTLAPTYAIIGDIYSNPDLLK